MSGNRKATIVVALAATLTGGHAWWASSSLSLGLVIFAISLIEGGMVIMIVRSIVARHRRATEDRKAAGVNPKRRQLLPRFKSHVLPAQRRPGVDDWVPGGWDLPTHEKAFRREDR